LVARPDGELEDRVVHDLPDLLRAGDCLVFNDTRVIPARLFGNRHRDGHIVRVEATLHKRLAPGRWSAFMRPGKRLQEGDRVRFGEAADRACLLASLDATIAQKGEGGEVTLAFDLSGPDLDLAIAERGDMPLPPYIAAKRPEDDRDRTDYQTIYAREDGSVAAPTAGLHFTSQLLENLKERGVSQHFVTLHVGAGTFLPVKTDDVADHKMHPEYGEVSAVTARALNAVRAADALMTNFHLPKSTLFMLVSAFAGSETMRAAYAHAIATGYRFYSYGDASLLWRAA